MGTSSEMLVRFGRRCGQARESTGELNGPIPAQGLFLAPGHGLRGEGAKRGLWLPSEMGSTKSQAALGASLGST